MSEFSLIFASLQNWRSFQIKVYNKLILIPQQLQCIHYIPSKSICLQGASIKGVLAQLFFCRSDEHFLEISDFILGV